MTHDEEKQLLRDERAGMEDLLQSRGQDIDDLKAEIRALTETIKRQDKIQWGLDAEIKELKETKTKKICPFMSQSHVTACRTDCRMWIPPRNNAQGVGYCIVADALKTIAAGGI